MKRQIKVESSYIWNIFIRIFLHYYAGQKENFKKNTKNWRCLHKADTNWIWQSFEKYSNRQKSILGLFEQLQPNRETCQIFFDTLISIFLYKSVSISNLEILIQIRTKKDFHKVSICRRQHNNNNLGINA